MSLAQTERHAQSATLIRYPDQNFCLSRSSLAAQNACLLSDASENAGKMTRTKKLESSVIAILRSIFATMNGVALGATVC
jgi:hypothetical protein